jgi:hypothetical protein
VLDPQDVRQGQVTVVPLELLRQGRPAEQRRPEQLRDLADPVRRRRVADVAGQLGGDEDHAGDLAALRRLQREEPTHAVAHRDDIGPQAVHRGAHVVDEGLE